MISKKLKYTSETMTPDKMLAGDILITTGDIFELIECLEIDDAEYWFLVRNQQEDIFDIVSISVTDDSVVVMRPIREITVGPKKSE